MTGVDFLLVVFIAIIFLIFLGAIKMIGNHNPKSFFDYQGDLKQAQPMEQTPPKPSKKQVQDGVLLGTCNNRNVCLPDDCKHVFLCGTTGAGKTIALSNFINNDYPLVIIDGKGDTDKNSLPDIVKQMKGNRKLYVIDMSDPENSDKYNPFSNTSATIIKDMLINMTDWTEPHYKINTERYLQRVIQTMIKANKTICLKTIIECLEIDNFLILSASLFKAGILSKEEHVSNGNLAKKSGGIAEDSFSRFANLIESDIGCIFDESGIDVYTAIKENAIILFILNPLLYPEVSPVLGRLITIDCKKAVSLLFKDVKKRFFFLFDEVNVYASTVLLDLINKSRSAWATAVLACQSLSDLDSAVSEAYRNQIIENTNNYIIMRQNSSVNAEVWAATIGTAETMKITYAVGEESAGTKGSMRKTREYIFHPDDIKNLGVGEAFVVSKDKDYKYKIKVNMPV